MNSKHSIKKLFYTIIGITVFSSCTTISYTPKVTLDLSPQTINKSVLVEKIKDLSPVEDKANPFLGLSVTNEESLPSGLELEVTNEIVSDFSNNALFSNISRRVENPDFIIKGDINKFCGKSEINTFGKVSYFMAMGAIVLSSVTGESAALIGVVPMLSWYFGVPISKNTSHIEITLRVYNSKGDLQGTYVGKAEDRTSTNMYKNKALAVPSMTNKTFSIAIQDIRDQILKDIDKYNR